MQTETGAESITEECSKAEEEIARKSRLRTDDFASSAKGYLTIAKRTHELFETTYDDFDKIESALESLKESSEPYQKFLELIAEDCS